MSIKKRTLRKCLWNFEQIAALRNFFLAPIAVAALFLYHFINVESYCNYYSIYYIYYSINQVHTDQGNYCIII